MKIFSAVQIRAWDAYTLENEPITSLDLMERAAGAFTNWFRTTYPDPTCPVLVVAGTGNNGGDGLAVARMLDRAQCAVKVVVCDFEGRHSKDFEAQLALIPDFSPVKPVVFRDFKTLQAGIAALLQPNTLVIDALFGSGLSRPLEGAWAQTAELLNLSGLEIASIDVPSGLYCDASSLGNPVVKARKTFSFETPKRAFFFPENAPFLGDWTFGSIGLHPDFVAKTATPFQYLTLKKAIELRRPRTKFSHKGSFGHALLIAGSWGKMGAAVLAARACIRAGAGLLTVHIPRCGNLVLQSEVPEAMVSADRRAKFWTELPDLSAFSSIGVGPGIGRETETAAALFQLLQSLKVPAVLDADALNLLAENPSWFKILPKNTILTPHPKEFERLFGKTADDFQRNELLRNEAQKLGVFIVLKGANSAIACPDGECWFNSTGNAGMATGGSGDVLTGILTGLLAQGYGGKDACLLGVLLHGLSGDIAAKALSQEGMIAGDLVRYLGEAWLQLA